MTARVSPTEARRLVVEEGYAYLDVRTGVEFASGHPTGSINVPLLIDGPRGRVLNERFMDEVLIRFSKSAKLVIGCRSGQRSLRAAGLLEAEGFEHVIDQRAGFDGVRDAFGGVVEAGWLATGLPIETRMTSGAEPRPPASR
jgi:rhodanese-related sulfurtransferase